MKTFLLLFSFLFFLSSCSSLEIDPATSSEDEAQKILALGLSHEESLRMASKLDSPHLVKIVTLKLNNARDEKIQDAIDLEKSQEFSQQVKVSNEGKNFVSLYSTSRKKEHAKNILANFFQENKTLHIDNQVQLAQNVKIKRSFFKILKQRIQRITNK